MDTGYGRDMDFIHKSKMKYIIQYEMVVSLGQLLETYVAKGLKSILKCCYSFLVFLEQGLTVINISATTFPQTLDGLHSYLLQVMASYVLKLKYYMPFDVNCMNIEYCGSRLKLLSQIIFVSFVLSFILARDK